tara:strand:+ start:19497 stop:20195 length:699 start_codon:yes stop_codon:yes gene_type:complete
MAWTAPRTYVAGEIITAAILNVDIRDNLNVLDLHVHGGAAGDGDDQLSGIDDIIFDDVSAPAAPGASKARLYFVSGVLHARIGASGADSQLAPDTKGDIITYSTIPLQLAVGSNDQVLTADSGEAAGIKWAAAGHVKVGSYTGDGTTSQGITGVGFAPSAVFVVLNQTGGFASETWYRTSGMDQSTRLDTGLFDAATDRIVSFDSDGFTVSDNSADHNPNTNSAAYRYLALG